MIFTRYLAELKRMDEMELEMYRAEPMPPVTFSNDQMESINKMNDHRRHIVKLMAVSLGLNVSEMVTFQEIKERVF